MSRFKYSDEEMNANKILKMNQDVARAMQNDNSLTATRESADAAIESSLNLLKSFGKQREIQKISSEIENNSKNRKLEHRPVLESWDNVVKQANEYATNPVVLEDIMTKSEIDHAFEELDDINKLFSQKNIYLEQKGSFISLYCYCTSDSKIFVVSICCR